MLKRITTLLRWIKAPAMTAVSMKSDSPMVDTDALDAIEYSGSISECAYALNVKMANDHAARAAYERIYGQAWSNLPTPEGEDLCAFLYDDDSRAILDMPRFERSQMSTAVRLVVS